MTRKRLLLFSLLIGFLLVCIPASAHHGAAAYSNKMLVLKDATVTKFVWANPHTILLVDVKDENGNVTHWAGEAGSPSAVGLLGWTKSSVQVGDVVTVYLFPSKSGSPVGRLNRIVFADGRVLKDSQLGGYKDQNEQ